MDRLENTPTASVPGRAINLARQGFVVFTYDAIGYNDSRQLTHTFDGRRERLWGLSLGGLQLWNSIRSLDFLESLPYVNRDAIGATGASGGGTQTFLVAAVDSRVKVAAPVNMISLEMQGGCLCENLPGLRLDTTNVEIAATIAPRPLLMISATGDWTHATLEAEYPAVRRFYELLGSESRVQSVRFDAPHNYNRDSREAVYAWMARWLQHAPADVKRPEKSFEADPLPDLLVFHQRALPGNAVTAEQLTDNWITAARRQLSSASRSDIQSALRHSLGFASGTIPEPSPTKAVNRTVLLGDADPDLERRLKRAGFLPKRFTSPRSTRPRPPRSNTSRPTIELLPVNGSRTSWPQRASPPAPSSSPRAMLHWPGCSPAPSRRSPLRFSTSATSTRRATTCSWSTCTFPECVVPEISRPLSRCRQDVS
jgi:hypothetical protein